MAATWIFGIALVLMGQWFTAGWFQAKFVLVIGMSVLHGLMAAWGNDFLYDRNRRPQKFYRIANEIPTLLMIAIVILVAVKPF
jgi:putative membrane protein